MVSYKNQVIDRWAGGRADRQIGDDYDDDDDDDGRQADDDDDDDGYRKAGWQEVKILNIE